MSEQLQPRERRYEGLTNEQLAELKEPIIETLYQAEQSLMEIGREEDERHQPKLDI